MSYQAIARKWRPTTFDEISGQNHVTRTLKNAVRLDRVHHAFLFSGPRGVGKTTAARALARSLNCEEGPTPNPCGECVSCKEILAGSSPDVIEIDGASNNSVEDVRDLRESVRYMPVHGRSKVYIVDEVHMLSKGAFNALLKTLEEPPAHVVFIFATTEPQRIPDTIISRVQRFDFKRIPVDVVVKRLQTICAAESINIGEDGLKLIARAGEGSMRDAQSLLDQVISFAGDAPKLDQVAEVLGLVDRRLLYQMLGGLLQGDADACLASIAAVYGYGYDLSEFTSELLELLRNATLVGLSPGSKRYLDIPEDERAQLEALVGETPSNVLVRAFQVMLEVHDQVARSNRPRLVLEMAVARLVCIRPAVPIDRLLDRLNDLEQRIRAGGGRVSPSPRASRQSPGPSRVAAPVAKEPEPAPVPEPAQAPEPAPAAPAVAAKARFDQLRAGLVNGGVRFDVWIEDSALVAEDGAVLRVVFPSEFKRRNAAKCVDDPLLIAGLKTHFPAIERLDLITRSEGAVLETPRERKTEAARVAHENLDAQLRAHPDVQKVCADLSAKVLGVYADRETPPGLAKEDR